MQTSPALIKIAAAWLLGLMLAIAAAVIAIVVINNTVAGPQQPVRDYLQALRDGDGSKALGLLHAKVPRANAAMLDGSALKKSVERISDVKLGSPQQQPDGQSKVTVSYTIDGSQLSSDFFLQRTGTDWLFFSRWSMVPTTLPTLNVSVVNESQASLNGVPVSMPSGSNSFSVFYPGEFQGSYEGTFFKADPSRATVTGPQSPSEPLAIATKATPALVQQVDSRIHEFLDGCAKQQVLQPAGCPFYFSTNNRIIAPVQWSIAQYPKVTIDPYNGKWVIAPLAGKAQLSTKQMDLFTGAVSDLKPLQNFNFTARLDVSGSAITVTPVVDY